MAREREEEINPYCCFNDMRAPDEPGWSAAGLDAAAVRAALAHTTLGWLPHPERMRCRFCLRVLDGPGAIRLLLDVDTRCLPADDLPDFLRRIEHLVVESAAPGPDPVRIPVRSAVRG